MSCDLDCERDAPLLSPEREEEWGHESPYPPSFDEEARFRPRDVGKEVEEITSTGFLFRGILSLLRERWDEAASFASEVELDSLLLELSSHQESESTQDDSTEAIEYRPISSAWQADDPNADQASELIDLVTVASKEAVESRPSQVYISPSAYLRSMWSLLWSALRHPYTTTYIDVTTGRVLRQ